MSELEAPPETKMPDAPPPGPKPATLAAVDAFKARLRLLTPTAWVTPALIGVNLAVFIAMVATGAHIISPSNDSLLRWGANLALKTTGGQWWRLVTCVFVHIGIIHVTMNMLVLWSIGRLVEHLVGSRGFLVAYLFAGICGSLGSIAWHPMLVSAGASGAVFGIYGVLIGFLARNRASIPADVLKALQKTTVPFLVYNLVFGLSVQGIDMAAHIGGLVAGGVFGLILSQPLDDGTRARRVRRDVMTLGAGIALSLVVALIIPHGPDKNLAASDALYEKAAQAFQAGTDRLKKHEISADELAKIVDDQVLPPLRESLASFQRARRVPAELREKFDPLLAARVKAFQAMADALRHGDDTALAEKNKQAWAEVKRLNEATKSKDDK
jgi:rhomboid protease GluP